MNLADEKWSTAKGFSNYLISSESRVINKTTLHLMKSYIHKVLKFRVITLTDDNGRKKLMKMYRLKALAFIPNPEGKRDVNHLDGNRLNESLDNLEWATQKENMRHAVDNGFCGGQFEKGLNHFKVKTTKDDVLLIRRWYDSGFYDSKKVAKLFGISPQQANRIGQRKSALYV